MHNIFRDYHSILKSIETYLWSYTLKSKFKSSLTIKFISVFDLDLLFLLLGEILPWQVFIPFFIISQGDSLSYLRSLPVISPLSLINIRESRRFNHELCGIFVSIDGIQCYNEKSNEFVHISIILNDKVDSSSACHQGDALPSKEWEVGPLTFFLRVHSQFDYIHWAHMFPINPESWSRSSHDNSFNIINVGRSIWLIPIVLIFEFLFLQILFSSSVCLIHFFCFSNNLIRHLVILILWIWTWCAVVNNDLFSIFWKCYLCI